MASAEESPIAIPQSAPTQFKYSKRVILKTILNREDGGLGLIGGERIVIGGWVKSSKEVRKDNTILPSEDIGSVNGNANANGNGGVSSPKDVSCVEILQSRMPLFFRSVIRALGGHAHGVREKHDSAVVKPSISVLQVSDGSCVASLQVLIPSALATPCHVMPTGTSILVEGVMKQPSVHGKHVIEFHVEKILHVGGVDYEKYPLSKKRLPLIMLRDIPHIRPRTTTVASIMRIRNALTFATHSFFQNHGVLNVQVPIITTTDCEGFSDKFHVAPHFRKAAKKVETNSNTTIDTEGVSLDVVKVSIKKKSALVEELQRSDSNKEALVIAVQDLKKANELALELEAKEKRKLGAAPQASKVNLADELFYRNSYLTVSGRLHLESFACSLGNVYSFGPRFRAVESDSAKHVSEMKMVELEMAFSDLEDVMNCAEDYLKFLCKWVLENCSEDVIFFSKRVDKCVIECLQSLISTSFEKLSYTEVVNMLAKDTDKKFKVKAEWGVTLTEEHVSYLADEIYKGPLIIFNYPKEVKPFYTRVNDDNKTVAAFELIVPMVGRLISGSQSEERIKMLETRIEVLGLPREQYDWYLDLRRHGTVKHSGFSFGFDLMVLLTTGLTDVRDVIPFPASLGNANN